MTHHMNPDDDAIDPDVLFAPLSERERVYILENLTPVDLDAVDAYIAEMREWLYGKDGTDE